MKYRSIFKYMYCNNNTMQKPCRYHNLCTVNAVGTVSTVENIGTVSTVENIGTVSTASTIHR